MEYAFAVFGVICSISALLVAALWLWGTLTYLDRNPESELERSHARQRS